MLLQQVEPARLTCVRCETLLVHMVAVHGLSVTVYVESTHYLHLITAYLQYCSVQSDDSITETDANLDLYGIEGTICE